MMNFGFLNTLSDVITSITALIQIVIIAAGIIATILCVKEEKYIAAFFCGAITVFVFWKMGVA